MTITAPESKLANRYSNLRNFSVEEQIIFSKALIEFFSPLNNSKFRNAVDLPVHAGLIQPLQIIDFLKFHTREGIDMFRNMRNVVALAKKLVAGDFLDTYDGIHSAAKMVSVHQQTKIQSLGILQLGRALGAPFIAHQIQKDIAYITGITTNGDVSSGTGLLVSETIILTCAHVVNDMTIDQYIKIGDEKVEIQRVSAHDKEDVAVIFLKYPMARKLPDLAFRCAVKMEEVVVAGFSPKPLSVNPCLSFQRGEICGHVEETLEGHSFDLFTSIARPGDSGGPIVAIDGRAVGMVTRSLERRKEDIDHMTPLPFFASVPAETIKKSFGDLTDGEAFLPWEDYQ